MVAATTRAMTILGPLHRSCPTSYTLWSHGRLLGETELGYTRCMAKHRAGDFHPTEFGETMMPIVTGAAVLVDAMIGSAISE